MPPLFRTEIQHLDGSVSVALVGELDVAQAGSLDVFRDLARRYDVDQLTLDCSRLTFLDASGLGALLAALRSFAPAGGKAQVLNPPRIVQLVLDVTGTAELFRVERRPEVDAPPTARPGP